MRGNRVVAIIGVLLILVVVIVGGLYVLGFFGGGGEDVSPADVPTVVPVDYVDIVVAANTIPRGWEIQLEDTAVITQPWPEESLPLEYFTSLEEVEGKYARMEIPRGMPILPKMVGEPGGMLNVGGSAASLFSPQERVAYAIPMDTQGAVAWAIKPGDRVDVIAAIKMFPVDPEFQTPLPNQFIVLSQGEDDEGGFGGPYGRFESLPNGQPAFIYPGGEIVPSLVVQLTVQDAMVWHIGIWEDTATAVEETVTPVPQPDVDGAPAAPSQPAAPTPIPLPQQRGFIEPVTLLVTREDALVLKYLIEMGADLDMVLRPAGYTETVIQTQPVWLRYVIDRYQLPETMPDLPVAPTPVRQVPLEVTPPTPEVAE